MDYKSCWLTVNRACNLRCKWCYAKSTNFEKSEDMPINLAYQILNICEQLQLKHITIIGGEPTIYPHLHEVMDYCNKKRLKFGMVTNGIRLADESFVEEMISLGMRSFSVSLKGETPEIFKDVSGFDCFEKVVSGIKICKSKGCRVSVSMVLTEQNVRSYLQGIKAMKAAGVDGFHLAFCYEFDLNPDYKTFLANTNPKKIVKGFVEGYDELNEITEGKFELFQAYPLCLWDKGFIQKLDERGQISTVCQLLHQSGLIFDTQGNIIPCNAMPQIKLGKLNDDFSTVDGLLKYMNRDEVKNVYNRLCAIPDEKCMQCGDLVNCGGGCVCQYTNYSYKQLMSMED